jgi:hypothetical protein
VSRLLLILVVLLLAAPSDAAAQQGSVQVSTSAQMLTGDPQLLGGQHQFEPDFGVSWLQPGLRFGSLQVELRGTRRYDLFHLGRTHMALRDVKFAGATWVLEGGDTYFSPAVGDYRFSNLFTPTVTFSGAMVSARTKRSHLTVVGGRATAWRNIFGSDPDSLGRRSQPPAEHIVLTIAGRVRPVC